jgi:hypothetical protein
MHPNSEWLIKWCDRMITKYGHPTYDFDWCRKLAYHMGEAGNDNPSYEAMKVAEEWEENNPDLGNNGEEIITGPEDDPRKER